jgi:hypothetical protein
MKMKPYYIVIILLFFACSNDDDNNAVVQEEKVIESFNPISISFVYEDGTSIEAGACLTPDLAYAVQIETTKNNEGNTDVSQIEYTINGALFSISFSEAGKKRNPIAFVEGKNIAELVKTAVASEVSYIAQDDFVLVE